MGRGIAKVTDFEIYGSLYIFGMVTVREFVFGTLYNYIEHNKY